MQYGQDTETKIQGTSFSLAPTKGRNVVGAEEIQYLEGKGILERPIGSILDGL